MGMKMHNIQWVVPEKDIGLTISADMKVSEQCGIQEIRLRCLKY